MFDRNEIAIFLLKAVAQTKIPLSGHQKRFVDLGENEISARTTTKHVIGSSLTLP
jgi:hypothetical protein